MKAYPAKGIRVLTGLALIISFLACSPKCVIKGRVMDVETNQPIKGAVVAIRWFESALEDPPAETATVDAVQALSDGQGIFLIPEYPEKKYVLGVYKAGYICWSSRDIFLMNPAATGAEKYRQRNSYQIKNGMQIGLRPFKRIPRSCMPALRLWLPEKAPTANTDRFIRPLNPSSGFGAKVSEKTSKINSENNQKRCCSSGIGLPSSIRMQGRG